MADHFRWVEFWKSSEKTFSYLNFFVFSWTAFFYFLLASHISKIKSNTHTGCWRQRVAGVHTLSIPTVVIHFHLKQKFLKRLAPLFIGIYALLCCREWIADSRARTRHIKSGRSLRKNKNESNCWNEFKKQKSQRQNSKMTCEFLNKSSPEIYISTGVQESTLYKNIRAGAYLFFSLVLYIL